MGAMSYIQKIELPEHSSNELIDARVRATYFILSRICDSGPGFKDPIWISFSQDGPNIRLEPAPGQSFLTWTDESDSDADDNLGGQDSSDDEVSETATSDAEEVSKNQQVRKSRSDCPYMVKI